jgi:hypothetical protein
MHRVGGRCAATEQSVDSFRVVVLLVLATCLSAAKTNLERTVLSLLFVDRVALEQETAVAVDKMKLKMIGSNSADTGTAQQQEQHYQKLTAEMQQQRQSLQELYQQVLQAAYANTNDPPEPTETSIKFAKRPVSIREFEKGQVLG